MRQVMRVVTKMTVITGRLVKVRSMKLVKKQTSRTPLPTMTPTSTLTLRVGRMLLRMETTRAMTLGMESSRALMRFRLRQTVRNMGMVCRKNA